MEVKRVNISWYEKIDMSENELAYAEELLAVDKDLAECDNILSEVGLQIGYSRYEKQIYEIAEKRQHLCSFVMALPDYMESHLDEPLRKNLNHGASETISRIHMADFQVENTLGLTVMPVNREYWGVPQEKDKLNLEDFIGNALGEDADGNRIPGTNLDCVEEFAVIFQQQYDNMLALGMLGEDPQELEDYLDQFASMGEYDHKEDQPFYKALLSNVLDLTIIKPIIESCCGYDLITGEDLTEMERNMKLIGAVVDLVTLATGIYGFTTAAKSMGWKKAASYFSQLALVELASDVSATTVATIGEYCDWPMGVTLLLSLGTGLTVGQVGNHLIFKRNGIEIFRKEVSESGELLEDLMSPEDAARFQKFLEEGSTAGLTPEELAGIGKVDDYVALNRVDYDDVFVLRREAIEGHKEFYLLDDTGRFYDEILENNYLKYVERNRRTGKPVRDRLDWKQASEYWRTESPTARGNRYNQTVKDADLYPYHEINLSNGKRLDSYDPIAREIISRKATDLDKISEETFRKYLSEISDKYSVGTVIRSNKYPELDGLKLEGQYILEIPASNQNLSNIKHFEDIAKEYGVKLRFTEE